MTSTEVSSAQRPAVELISALRIDTQQARETMDRTEIIANALDNIASAETLEDLFAANESGLPSAEDVAGIPLNITDVVFMTSDEKYAKEGIGSYVVVSYVTDGGESKQFSTGATNIVASLFQAYRKGFFSEDKPMRCKLRAKETANGTLYLLANA